ncbi:MAG: NifB/NifX family molybdenum-iron cluster-binding protein [Oceanidesulfovibrio sp.]
MKIAISSPGPDLSAPVDPRFGRASGFILVDEDTGAVEYVNNEQNLNLAQGAGIQSAMNVARTGAGAVITGHVGPKAFAALNKGNIAVYLCDGGNVADALESFKRGELARAQGPDKEGHW